MKNKAKTIKYIRSCYHQTSNFLFLQNNLLILNPFPLERFLPCSQPTASPTAKENASGAQLSIANSGPTPLTSRYDLLK